MVLYSTVVGIVTAVIYPWFIRREMGTKAGQVLRNAVELEKSAFSMVIFPTGSVRLLYWCTVVSILVVFCASCTEHCATILALLWVVLTPINYPTSEG